MSHESEQKVYVPPYSGVRLVECRNHFQLVPVADVQTVYGYGKIESRQATIDPGDPASGPIWDNLAPDEKVWAVMQWYRYADGHQESGDIIFMHPECPEEQVKRRMEMMAEWGKMTRKDALGILQCYDAPEEDQQYVEDNFPNYQAEPDPALTDEYDIYHARLKVMSELQPKTVELMKIVNATKDPVKRKFVENQAVQSLFAELAHYFTEGEILAWQRSNPVGTGWMCEFAAVMGRPRRQLDPINHELALNWLRSKYNEMTASELSGSIWAKVWRWLEPGFRLTAEFIKKRRERLGLTSKRPQGPRPKSDGQ